MTETKKEWRTPDGRGGEPSGGWRWRVCQQALAVAVERGSALAEKLYKTDTDSDDPNKAVKAFWPSTNARSNFVRITAEVSPDATRKMVNDIPDGEIRPLIRIALAASWLGASSGTSFIMTETKKGARTTEARGGE